MHGIWDDGARFDVMRRALERRGHTVRAIDLRPNDGSVSVEHMAEQVDAAARALGSAIDLVGFSMGALVSRFWIQRGEGRARVRRFVSISGPHHGTATAYALPLAGVRQMRPGSARRRARARAPAPGGALLRSLARDPDPWGDVDVHTVWTPMDLMILPPRSSRLPGATEHRVPVPLHRWMITDRRVVERVAGILG